MANTGLITDLNSIGVIDRSVDVIEIVDVSANTSFKVTPNNLFGISGGNLLSTTDSQTISNKTVDNTNVITVKDAALTLQNNADNTKQVVFNLGSITTGTTRTFSFPDSSTAIVGAGSTQTLTNKTLTSPVITGGSIDNSAVTVDSIAGHTTSNTGSIYGISVTTGTIGTAGLASNSVTGSKIASYSTSRNNNGSNTSETSAKMQTGWICGQPGASAAATFNVTFPVPFTNVPVVNATFGGDTAGITSTLGAGGGNVKTAGAEAFGITTTGFVLVCRSIDGTSWSAGNTVYAQWIAVGT